MNKLYNLWQPMPLKESQKHLPQSGVEVVSWVVYVISYYITIICKTSVWLDWEWLSRFEYLNALVPSWWNCLRRVRRCKLVSGDVSLGMRLYVAKSQAIFSYLSLPCLRLSICVPTIMPLLCHHRFYPSESICKIRYCILWVSSGSSASLQK